MFMLEKRDELLYIAKAPHILSPGKKSHFCVQYIFFSLTYDVVRFQNIFIISYGKFVFGDTNTDSDI